MRYVFIILTIILVASGCSVCSLEKDYDKETTEVSNYLTAIGNAMSAGEDEKYLSLISSKPEPPENEIEWVNYYKENNFKLDHFSHNVYVVYYDTNCSCLKASAEVSLSISNETYNSFDSQTWYMTKINGEWTVY